MKNLIAINGSPRRNRNTAELLQHAMKGAEDAGASTELINLYALNFKGCTSCFACKLKNRPHGVCAMKDDLSPVLKRIKNADAIIFGTHVDAKSYTVVRICIRDTCAESFLFGRRRLFQSLQRHRQKIRRLRFGIHGERAVQSCLARDSHVAE